MSSRVLLVLLGLAAALVLSEAGLRLSSQKAGDFRFPTSRAWDGMFETRAGEAREREGVRYTFDKEGFRDWAPRGAPGPPVLFIGDSFTLGLGVGDRETFPAAAEAGLLKRGVKARCRNAGVEMFGTSHELRLLARLVDRGGVQGVVVQLFPFNDLTDNWQDGGFAEEAGALRECDPPRIPRAVRLRDRLFAGLRRSVVMTVLANALFDNDTFLVVPGGPEERLEAALLSRMSRLCRERRVPLLFLVVPTQWESSLGGSPGAPASLGRYERVLALVAATGEPFLDLRKVVSKPEHYIPGDGHFSALGNGLVGEAVAERLAPLLKARSRPLSP